MKCHFQQHLVLMLLLQLLIYCGGSHACASKPPAPAPAPAPVAPPVTVHASIECNQFERPALNCTGEGTSCRGYKCICSANGHVYVPTKGCQDIDECTELPQPCKGAKVSCMNVNGGYQCICNEEGHRYHPFKGCGEHNLCHFPFKYKGTYYHHCIRSNHHRLWCSQTEDYDRDGKFVNCASEFLTMHCHFPFVYNGKEYKQCVGEGEEKWCATTYNYDSDRLWDICY